MGTVITRKLDRRFRTMMSTHYFHALKVLELNSADAECPGVWTVAPGSPADDDRGVATYMRQFIIAEIMDTGGEHPGESNLPLTFSRRLLQTSAGGMAAVAELSVSPNEPARLAGIGALARSVAEHSATAHWILSGADRDARLRRALLMELNGIKQLLRYLPNARLSKDASDLEAARTRLLEIANENFAEVCPEKLRIDRETLPNLTNRVTAVLSRDQYAELNVFTHPTGHIHAAVQHSTSGANRQTVFAESSTLHDESRLMLAAATAYANALAETAAYIGAPVGEEITNWLRSCAETSTAWCEANGCA